VYTDDPAFSELFELEYPLQVRTAYLIVGDEGLAREIAQEAFARAMARWRRLKHYERPGAWLRLVTVRLALRTRDHRVREPAIDPNRAADLAVVDAPTDPAVVAAVLDLPRRQRAAVTLHYLCDQPVDEVARLMGTKAATVRVHLHRARARLAVVLGEEMSDESP
jgi:RNA polymerase sigma-70 factor (ECF subfamily)